MARILIRQAHGGATRIISDPALPYFLNQGWVVLDTLDDDTDASPLYLSAAEGDLRWAKISDLGDPESAEVAVISEAVADSEALRAAFVTTADIWPLRKFGAITPGADHTAVLQAAADAAAAAPGGATIICPAGIDLRVTGVTVHGRFALDLQNSLLTSIAAANTTPLFTIDPNLGGDFGLYNGRIASSNTVLKAEGAAGYTGSIFVNCHDLTVVNAVAARADYWKLKSVDRSTLRNIINFGGGKVLTVAANYLVGERSNTQLDISNFFVYQCLQGADLSGIDKAHINIDCSLVGTGIVLSGDNHRINFDRCHVEFFGDPAYTAPYNGRGFAINMASVQRNLVFNQCSIFLPGTNAVAGFEHYGVIGANETVAPVYNQCHADIDLTKTGYRPLDLQGPVEWNGRWKYTTDVRTHLSASRWTDLAVKPQNIVAPRSRNLLPMSRISSLGELPTLEGAGTVAVTSYSGPVPNGRTVTITGQALRYRVATLAVGWHTLIWEGYASVGDFYLFAMQHSGSFSMYANANFQGDATNGQLYRLPFYVSVAGQVRIGVQSFGSGGSAVIGQVELHQGFVTAFTDDPTVSWASSAPASGVYAVGDRVRNSAPAASGAPGWVCVAAPSTFKAEPSLAA